MQLIPFTVGRRKEVFDFRDHVKDGTPVLYYGSHGLGKTHLLRNELIDWLDIEGIPYIYLPRFSAHKDFLVPILEKVTLSGQGQDKLSVHMIEAIAKGNPRSIVGRIVAEAHIQHPNKKFVLVVDSMELMNRTDQMALMELYDCMYICGAYSERRGGSGGASLSVFLDMFTRVNVIELQHQEIVELMNRLLIHFNIDVSPDDMQIFRNYILNNTFYMTLGVVETLSRLKNRKIRREEMDSLPVHTGGRKEMSMAIMWVIIWIIYPMVTALLWRAVGNMGASWLVRAIGIIFLGLKLLMPTEKRT